MHAAGSAAPAEDRGHVRRRVTSRSERSAMATHAIMVLAVLGLFCFLLAQDLESPYSEALAGLWGVLAASRFLAWWTFGFVYSDAGLLISTSMRTYWLAWSSVTAISEAEISRQSLPSLVLGGGHPVRVLRIHRRFRGPIRVRATRGIDARDLAALRTIALRNGTKWQVGNDFGVRARERGIWALGGARR